MQAQNFIGGNLCLGKAGLTGLSGAATTFTTAAQVLYALTGKLYTKAAIAGGATPTVDGVTGNPIVVVPGKGTNVTFCLDASGNVYCVQGSSEILEPNNTFRFAAPQFPALPDALVPFAYAIIKNATTGTNFTVGVSNWNQAGITVTNADLMAIPNRPQSA